jgi:uncharacterized protein (TIGR01777 family)
MRVLLAGASGMIGGALRARLEAAGDEVRSLTRAEGPDWTWTGQPGSVPPQAIEWADSLVSLNGAPLARLPWTPARKRAIMRSRVDPTSALARALLDAADPPGVWVSASACGYYGAGRGADRLTEAAASGPGFLAGVVRAWEAAALPAAGVTRLVRARTGMVVAGSGMTSGLALATRWWLGPRFGSGGQYWPWISLRDEVRAIEFALRTDRLRGPANLAGPEPATADQFMSALASALRRPAWVRVPAWALRAALDGAAQDLILASQRAEPEALLRAGFEFLDTDVSRAIAAAGLSPDSLSR